MQLLNEQLDEHLAVGQRLRLLLPQVQRVGNVMTRCLMTGGKVLWMGNGGSAADCQHMSAELVGRFMRERKGLASIALTTDTSALTSIGNDFGYLEVFRRQVEALARPGDVVIGLSTSGRSKNIVVALQAAQAIGAYRVGMTGQNGAEVASLCDECICVPSGETPRIQEAHNFLGHLLCKIVDDATGTL